MANSTSISRELWRVAAAVVKSRLCVALFIGRKWSRKRACDCNSSFLRCQSIHAYEVRPRKDHRGVDLISDVRPFGRLWYGEPSAISNAIGYAEHYSRSRHAVIRPVPGIPHAVIVRPKSGMV
jgi:hypothetical protein